MLKDTYMHEDFYFRDCHNAKGKVEILKGWNVAAMTEKLASIVTKFDSVESIVTDIITFGQWDSIMHMYKWRGIYAQVNPGTEGYPIPWLEEVHVNGGFYMTPITKEKKLS